MSMSQASRLILNQLATSYFNHIELLKIKINVLIKKTQLEGKNQNLIKIEIHSW